MAILSIAMLVFGCSKDDSPAEVVKTKVKITGYRIDSFSFVANDGLGWDGISGSPDVYSGIFNGNSTLIVTSNIIDNVSASMLPITVTLNSPYLVPNFSDTINVVVMDSDNSTFWATSDDEIGFVPFIMSDYTTGADKYPTTKTKTANGVSVTLFLTWE